MLYGFLGFVSFVRLYLESTYFNLNLNTFWYFCDNRQHFSGIRLQILNVPIIYYLIEMSRYNTSQLLSIEPSYVQQCQTSLSVIVFLESVVTIELGASNDYMLQVICNRKLMQLVLYSLGGVQRLGGAEVLDKPTSWRQTMIDLQYYINDLPICCNLRLPIL